MNEFEKYIRKNKDQLESREVDSKVWLSIENEVLKSKQRRRSIYLRVVSAAAIALLGILIFGGGLFGDQPLSERELLEKYGLAQYEFTQQVNLKKDALSKATIPSTRQEDFKILLRQLEFLDEQYSEYLKNIETDGYQPLIGEQLLKYYHSKIELLDKIQQEIEKVNYYENKFPGNDEKVGLQI